MAKKKFQKYMSKVGGTAAVALAMTVALSSQANAAEIDDVDVPLCEVYHIEIVGNTTDFFNDKHDKSI